MKKKKKIFFVRPTEPNRGDMMSRYGLLKIVALENKPEQVIVLTNRSISELPAPFITIRPGKLKDLIPRWEQVRLYARGDEVWWACGLDMQDDSSMMKLPFLVIKFLFFRAMGLKIKIVAQGAGPITSLFGKWCVKAIIGLVQEGSFRDRESLSLVESIAGQSKGKLTLTVDGAIYAAPETPEFSSHVSDTPLLLGVNVRRWFHFDGSWMPYEHRTRLGLLKFPPGDDKMKSFLAGMTGFLDNLIESHGIRIRFIPMYPPFIEPWEDDCALLKDIRAGMAYKDNVQIIDEDLSPEELLHIFSGIDVMIGVRLHSTIIATALGIPSIHLAYSAKGFSYFKFLGQERFCVPLEKLTDQAEWDKLSFLFSIMMKERSVISRDICAAVRRIRTKGSSLPIPAWE